MILITGANGNFGKSTIDFLLKKGIDPSDISGMVRDPSKASGLEEKGVVIRIGDYDDYDSLGGALEGVEKLLLVSGTDLTKRARQHEDVLKAAVQSGVKHLVYTSFERRYETVTSPIYKVASAHLHTERVIKKSGIPYTILRNNLYMDGLPVFLGDKVLESGIYFPAGDTRAAFALRIEMAEAAANVLSGEGHENRQYFISNSEEMSFSDIADVLSEIAGKTVSYTSPELNAYKAAMAGAGMPEEAISFFAIFAEGVKQGEFLPPKSDLEQLIGRKPTTVREFLASCYGPAE